MTKKIFVSKIDPSYSVECTKDHYISYILRYNEPSTDLMADLSVRHLSPDETPEEICDELLPLAREWLDWPMVTD